MLRRLFVLLGGVLLVALFTLSTPALTTFAALTTTASGTINTLDLAHNQIAIALTSGGHVNLKVPTSTKITRNGVKKALKGLVLRDHITAQYDSATGKTTSLKASGPAVTSTSGHLKSALKGKGQFTIGNKTFRTNANTTIARNGRIVSLGALTRKDSLVVHTQAGTNLALDVLDDGPEEGQVEGTITAVDTTGNTVTITPANGTPAVTVTVNSSTMIEVNDSSATISDLQVNMTAEAEYDPNTLVAFSIEAQSEGEDAHVMGTVGAVDTTAGTITINPSDNSPALTLNVTADTDIQVNGEDATLADVQVNMPVMADYNTVTLTAKEIDAGTPQQGDNNSEVEGTVAAVTSTSVTITPHEGGSAVTVNVDGSTEIQVNDQPGTISQIQVGDSVHAEYDPTTMLASEIEDQGQGGGDRPQH